VPAPAFNHARRPLPAGLSALDAVFTAQQSFIEFMRNPFGCVGKTARRSLTDAAGALGVDQGVD
jgi:hypothetical protein